MPDTLGPYGRIHKGKRYHVIYEPTRVVSRRWVKFYQACCSKCGDSIYIHKGRALRSGCENMAQLEAKRHRCPRPEDTDDE